MAIENLCRILALEHSLLIECDRMVLEGLRHGTAAGGASYSIRETQLNAMGEAEKA
jgi:hypothetical protein